MITLIPGRISSINNSAIRYGAVAGVGSATTVETSFFMIVPTDGVINNVKFKLSAAPGAGKSYTVGLRINASTIDSVVISDSDVDGEIIGPYNVAPGDTLTYITTPSGTPVANPQLFTCLEFEGDDATESIILGTSTSTQSTTTGFWYSIWGASAGAISEVSNRSLMPTSGTFKKFYWKLNNDPGTSPDAYTATLKKNDVATSLTSTIVADNTTGNDTTNSFTTVAGDTISLKIDPVSTPSVGPRLGWGVVFIPDTTGEAVIMGFTANPTDASATEYNYLGGVNGTFSTTEASFTSLLDISTLKKLYVKFQTAPGSGKSYALTVRDDSADTSLVATVTNTNTTADSSSNTHDVTDISLVNLKIVPSGTPASNASSAWSVVVIAPTINTFTPSPMMFMMAQSGGLI